MNKVLLFFVLIFQPLANLFTKVFGININLSLTFDSILILLLLIGISVNRKIPRNYTSLILLLALSLIFIFSLTTLNNAYLMELKGMTFLFLCLLTVPTKFKNSQILKYLKVFNFLLLSFYIFKKLTSFSTNRFELGLVGEVNYDLAVPGLLIAYLLSQNLSQSELKSIKLLLINLGLLSIIALSRSGMITFGLLVFWYMHKKGYRRVFTATVVTMLFLVAAIITINYRGGFANLTSIDRILFAGEYLSYFKNEPVNNLFPSNPSSPLYMDSFFRAFDYYKYEMGGRNNLNGVYPFMYHSLILRILAQYGFIFSLLLFLVLIKRINHKVFYVILLLSTSMSTLFIPQIAITALLLKNK